jgi:hypothetical protein
VPAAAAAGGRLRREPVADDPSAAPGPDYKRRGLARSPNFSSRPGGAPARSRWSSSTPARAPTPAAGAGSSNQESGVSAHYVVKEDGSEISQLVKEAEQGLAHRRQVQEQLNGGKFSELEGSAATTSPSASSTPASASRPRGTPTSSRSRPSWSATSPSRHNIPRDKYHIVGHGQLQPYNRSDPGPNWPWATYLAKINSFCPRSRCPATGPRPPRPPASTAPATSTPTPPRSPTPPSSRSTSTRRHQDHRRLVDRGHQPLRQGPLRRLRRQRHQARHLQRQPDRQRRQVGPARQRQVHQGVEQGRALALDHRGQGRDRRRGAHPLILLLSARTASSHRRIAPRHGGRCPL